MKKFKRIAVLDTVIFYPEHRKLLNQLAEEVLEFPSSLPEGLEKQYTDHPELFVDKKCYTQIATDNIPLQLLMNRVEGADVIISCWTNIPDEILKLNPQLKLIIFWTHEKEHRINMRLADELGITIANIPDYGTDAVAEVVFAGLWQLLIKNFASPVALVDETSISNAIINDVFTKFRMLPNNEKYTRSGKFSHHFHKLGLVNFDFNKKDLDQLIPERLVEYKHVGILNIDGSENAMKTLRAFGVIAESMQTQDFTTATAYKFLAENEIVYSDVAKIDANDRAKIETMFPGKLVDIQTLKSSSTSFIGKTFGIVGLGRIGTRVAVIAKKLGFHVIYFSKSRQEEIEKDLGITFVSLNDLSAQSDAISIHVPAHKAENVIDAAFIEAMKPGSFFINTADGNALDQKALTKRMEAKEIFAFLDVYPGLPRKDILELPMNDKTDWKLHRTLENNVLAYRAGWKTQESIRIKTYKLLGALTDHLLNSST